MGRLATLLLAALALAPAGLAAQTSGAAGPGWNRVAQESRSTVTRRASLGIAEQQAALASDLLQGINNVRQQRGLRALVLSSKLAGAAAQHTREMGLDGYFEHESFDSTPFWKRIERWYPSRGWSSWAVGENLLYSSPGMTASEGVSEWMSSPPHRANLLSRTWREIGISATHFESAPGEYDGAPVTIATADFGARR
jgi:uncharacterized protein YkwD